MISLECAELRHADEVHAGLYGSPVRAKDTQWTYNGRWAGKPVMLVVDFAAVSKRFLEWGRVPFDAYVRGASDYVNNLLCMYSYDTD